MNYLSLPKIDLHCHLDGSIRPSTICELLNEIQQSPEKYTHIIKDIYNFQNIKFDENFIKKQCIAPLNTTSLNEYLKCFDYPILIMQTYLNIKRITLELLEDCANENIKYIEIRYAPLL
ncbi:MAG: hypothetical protein LBR30_00500, partial [Clostridioides sp.]|nr:hypothetical protein [Clostridioides sp.]